jgi:hypothetical protein
MGLVVEIFGIARNQCVLQGINDSEAHEVVVPYLVVRNHEKSEEVTRKD